MIQNFVIDPTSVSREEILADLQSYLASVPDTAKWKDFFTSSTGETVLELIAGFGAFLTYNAIVARREAFWQNAVNQSSVIAGAKSLGYSAFRGQNAVLALNVTPIITGVLNNYSIVGSVGDQDLILLGDTIVNAGVATTLNVVIGTLQSQSITIDTNDISSFRFTQSGVSENVLLTLNEVPVNTSTRILDLLNQDFVMQTNPLGSVDVSYLNSDNFTVQYAVGDILTLTWVALNNITFAATDLVFDYGALNSFVTVSAFQDVESNASIQTNASLFNETQFIIRGRNDFLKIFAQLDTTNLVDTSGTDVSPAVVELSYVRSDWGIYLPSELNTLLISLNASRPFGVAPATIAPPGIVFLNTNIKVVPLANATGNATAAVNAVIDPYMQVLGQECSFEAIENAINQNSFVKISRISVNALEWAADAPWVRGEHVLPTPTNTGLIYEATGLAYYSGATEPTWICTVGDTVVDNRIVWTVQALDTCNIPPYWAAGTRYKLGDIVQSHTQCSGMQFQVTDFKNYSASTQDVQSITFSAIPTAGTWRIEFNGGQTADLPYNATASQIQTALNSGVGGLSGTIVTGNYADGFTVTFAGADANQAQPGFTFASLGANESQCLEFSGTPNAGAFVITFNGQSTSPIPANAAASDVETALGLLSNIGVGNVNVTGNFANNFNINFQGALSSQALPEVTITSDTLTQANVVTSSVSTVQTGIPVFNGANEVQLISFGWVPATGYFVLNFNQQVTGNLPFNITASQLQTAVQNLSTVGIGNATVTGDFTAGFSIEFTGSLGNTDVVPIFIPQNTLQRSVPVVPGVTTVQTGGEGDNNIQQIAYDLLPDSGTWELSLTYGGQAEQTQVTCTADISGELNGTYWTFCTPAQNYYVWYNVSSSGTDPMIADMVGIEVDIITNSTAATVVAATISAINNIAGVNVTASTVSATQLSILNAAQGAVTAASGQTSGFSCLVVLPGINPTSNTVALTPNVTNVQMQNALQNLPNVGTGNVQVTGNVNAGFTIEFQNSLGNLAIPQLVVVNNTLSQTQNEVITVTTPTQGAPPAAGANDIQLIQFSATPDSGSWAIQFNSNTSPTLQFNAAASDVQNAINAIPGLTGVSVTGTFVNGFTVEFAGANGFTNQPALIVVNNTLFSNSIPITVTPCLNTQGQYPAQNLTDVTNGTVAIDATQLNIAADPEPAWFSGAFSC